MSSDFITKEGKIIEYTGNGGDIIIPNGVIELDELNFTKKVHKYEYDLNGNILKDNVSYNFETKKLITSIYVPNSVKRIDEETFSELINLKKITFADNICIYEIPKFAFSGCKSLKHITLPESVQQINSYAFSDCCDITVKIGCNCRVASDIFGCGEYKSIGSKVEIPNNYRYKNEISKNLLLPSNNHISYTNTPELKTSGLDLNGFQIFLLIMAVVYLILFFVSFSIFDGHESMFFIVIGLGIINAFTLLNS